MYKRQTWREEIQDKQIKQHVQTSIKTNRFTRPSVLSSILIYSLPEEDFGGTGFGYVPGQVNKLSELRHESVM